MFEVLRQQMVQKCVIDAGINDRRVIAAMSAIPRHLFVEPALAHQAYQGSSLPIGFGQTISHPTTVATMTAALELSGDEKILEIGTGSGYQAAVLAALGANVFTIERIPELARQAEKILHELKFYQVAIRIGDGSRGWPQFAPFQRIILTAHSRDIPEDLLRQLDEGGILIMPKGDEQKQSLIRLIKNGNEILQETISAANFVPMIKNS